MLSQLVPPAFLPVALEDLKVHLGVSTAITETDSLIQQYCVAAASYIEEYAHLSLVDTTWEETFHLGECRTIRLDRRPLIEVVSMDLDGESLDLTDFNITKPHNLPTTIRPKAYDWPYSSSTTWPNQFLTVQYRSGYLQQGSGDSILGDLPGQAVGALYLLVGHMYLHREQEQDVQPYALKLGVNSLLDQLEFSGCLG